MTDENYVRILLLKDFKVSVLVLRPLFAQQFFEVDDWVRRSDNLFLLFVLHLFDCCCRLIFAINLLQLFILNEFFFLSFLFLVLEKVVTDRLLMKVLKLIIVEFSAERIGELRILIHRGFEHPEVHNVFGPDVVSYVVVYIGQVCHIGDSLFFSPLFVDGLSQFHEGFLQALEVLVVELEHEAQVPLQFPCVSVKVVTVHELRLLGIGFRLI